MSKAQKAKHIFLSCFEISGDQHAASIVRHARKHFSGKFVFSALGGEDLKSLSSTTKFNDVYFLEDTVTYSSVGFLEGLPYIFSFRSLYKKVKLFLKNTSNQLFFNKQEGALLKNYGPVDVFLCIDGQGRNFSLAKLAKKMGYKISYFFPPPVFIWGKWNIAKLQSFNKVFTVFAPNEKILKAGGVNTCFIGHPLVEVCKPYMQAKKQSMHQKQKNTHLVSIFPGSRFHEINALLPVFLKAAYNLSKKNSQLKFIIAVAHSEYKSIITNCLNKASIKNSKEKTFFNTIKLQSTKINQLLAKSRFVFCCSGTAGLKAAMFGVPHVIAYKISFLSAIVAKFVLHVKFISMANILFEKEVSKELINKACNSEKLQREAEKWLFNKSAWKEQSISLRKVNTILAGKSCLNRLCKQLLKI